ncbi:MAG: hypothetical protein LBV43_05875 [Prevotella sp.]|jgi:hypothetical protein|nr:hypothetical protein [Prevotella sp.]
MKKHNRFLSFELLLALLFIIAFFLPWLDWGMIKVVGWDIPDLQKKLTRVTNFLKFFSKNKDWIYSTHVVYLIPALSVVVMALWLMIRPKLSRIFLLITGVFSLIVAFNLFYKLPKAGSGVYLLCACAVVSIVYCIYAFRRKKKVESEPELETEMLEEPPTGIEEPNE